MRIAGRTALVTGASGGLGAAIARLLAECGANLVLTGRRTEVMRQLAEEIGASVVECDLTDQRDLAALARLAAGAEVLVANAGVDAADDLVEMTPDEIARVVGVNLTAPTVLAGAAARGMKHRGEGHIVLISSMAGKLATVGNGSLYAATKWGVRGLGLSLREELHGTGVGVSSVFPGPIREAGMFADTAVPLPRSIKTNSPRDVAQAVVLAVERNRAEIDVAPARLRLGGVLGPLLPRLVARLARREGVGEVRAQMAAARRSHSGQTAQAARLR